MSPAISLLRGKTSLVKQVLPGLPLEAARGSGCYWATINLALFALDQGPELRGQVNVAHWSYPAQTDCGLRWLELEERYAHFCRFLMLVDASRLAGSQFGLSRAAAGDHAQPARSARHSLRELPYRGRVASDSRRSGVRSQQDGLSASRHARKGAVHAVPRQAGIHRGRQALSGLSC